MRNNFSMDKSQPERILFLVLIVCLIFLGLIFFNDYGQSWDEYFNVEAGRRAIEAYRSGSFLRDQGEDYYHGTFYFMLYYSIPKGLHLLRSSWLEVDLRHLLNFSTFLLAVVSFFSLARKFFGSRFAILSVLLFSSQPLILGHAFINQKDMPFLGFFLSTMVLGLISLKTFKGGYSASDKENLIAHTPNVFKWFKTVWVRSSVWNRAALLAICCISTFLIVDLIFPFVALPLGTDILESAYRGRAPGLIQSIFDTFATDSYKTELGLYINKLSALIFWSEFLLLALMSFVTIHVLRALDQAMIGADQFPFGKWKLVVFAGVVLGLTCSIRIFGLFAGSLVTIYGLLKKKKAALRPLAVYWGIAILTTYITWPALWGHPAGAFFERVLRSVDFEPHYVLFEGALYQSNNLPWRYLPSLLTRQLTEPVLIGIAIGLVLILTKRVNIHFDLPLVLVALLWFAVPLVAQMLLKFSIYGNFRQLLFITPPLFMLGALGWNGVFHRIPRIAVGIMIVGLILFPIIGQIINYHPYEYVYYNKITGGIQGAHENFPLDYWCTSYREAIEWINVDAAVGSQVRVYGPDLNPRTFGREDLEIVPDWQPASSPDYTMLCTSIYPTPGVDSTIKLVNVVDRSGIIMTEIYMR